MSKYFSLKKRLNDDGSYDLFMEMPVPKGLSLPSPLPKNISISGNIATYKLGTHLSRALIDSVINQIQPITDLLKPAVTKENSGSCLDCMHRNGNACSRLNQYIIGDRFAKNIFKIPSKEFVCKFWQELDCEP